MAEVLSKAATLSSDNSCPIVSPQIIKKIPVDYFPGLQASTKEKVLKTLPGSSRHGSAIMNPTRNNEVMGSIPGLAQWVDDPVLS